MLFSCVSGVGNCAGHFIMRYSLKQTVAPTTEPVTLNQARAHLRLTTTTEDGLIEGLIQVAREMAQTYTKRQLITATYTAKYRDFPDSEGSIQIPRTPLQSVSSITYIDNQGATQTLSTDVYEVLEDDTEAYVVLKPLKSWPEVQAERKQAVTVTFVAGYGNAGTAVPAAAKSAMLMLIGHLFENRESVNVGNITSKMPMATEILLDSIRVKGPA